MFLSNIKNKKKENKSVILSYMYVYTYVRY